MPRRMNRSVSVSMTSIELSFRLTRISRDSRVCSSMRLSVRKTLPSSVRWCTKSYDQTWSRYLGLSRTYDPSFNHSRPFLGRFDEDFQPFSLPKSFDPLVIHMPAQRHLAGQWQNGDNRNGRTGALSSIISATNRSSSSRPLGMRRCVARCYLSTRQMPDVRETPNLSQTLIDTLPTTDGAELG